MQPSKMNVKITYTDGRTEEYVTLKEAGAALGVSSRSIRKFEFGKGRKQGFIKSLGVASIKTTRRPPYTPPSHRPHRIRIRLVHADGRVMEFDREKDAEDFIGCSRGGMTKWRNDGLRHNGWLVEELEEEDDSTKIKFGPIPLPPAYVDELYRMAHHCIIKYWGRYASTDKDAEDAVQDAVARTAADYSNGKYDPARFTKWQTWAYFELRHKIYNVMMAVNEHEKMMDDGPADDRDEWLDKVAMARSPDMDDAFLEELPADLVDVARLMLEGRNQYEICCTLGRCEATVRKMEHRIARCIAGDEDESDSR